MPRYEPTWESLEEHSIPKWFKDAPFGVHFHWGPYAVPAYANEWYSRNMYQEGTDAYEHHREEWGSQAEFGYKDFIPKFAAENWDPAEWVDLCAEAGAAFVGITAVHADGFLLWNSAVSRWNAANMGPERDVLGELSEAARDRGLKFVTSVHHACHWWWYNHQQGWDTGEEEYAGLYGQPHDENEAPPASFFEDWRDTVVEVIDGYRPDLLYFDWGWGNDWFVRNDEYRREVVAHYYNRAEEWGTETDICHKTNIAPGVGIIDHERTREDDVSLTPWLTDTPMDVNSWGYVEDSNYKSVNTMVCGLVDRASKNGRTTLNVGPKPDGTLPDPAVERLERIGEWFDTNGEVLCGTRPWWTFGEGPTEVTSTEYEDAARVTYTPKDIRFTRTDGTVYAVFLGWPEEPITISTPVGRQLSAHTGEWSLGPDPEPWGEEHLSVELLGSERSVEWERTEDGLRVVFPDERSGRYAYALRIDLDPE